jgi:uncharacterized protein YndB with AHSA1/START domain
MPTESLHVSAIIPASPRAVYDAWLSSDLHAKMTGSPAEVDARVGGSFKAWDGYIRGKTILLEPASRILQLWRTTEFDAGDEDSQLDVRLEQVGGHTRITIAHTDIPSGQAASYEGGWRAHYFEPMIRFFGGKPAPSKKVRPEKAAAKRAATRKTTAKKAVTKKGAARKTATRKSAAKKTAAKKAPAKKAPAKKGARGSRR